MCCLGPVRQLVALPGKKKAVTADDAATSLVEVGPRACLQPIKIFAGSFGGPVLYENPAYVSPNKARPLLAQPACSMCVAVLAAARELCRAALAVLSAMHGIQRVALECVLCLCPAFSGVQP